MLPLKEWFDGDDAEGKGSNGKMRGPLPLEAFLSMSVDHEYIDLKWRLIC